MAKRKAKKSSAAKKKVVKKTAGKVAGKTASRATTAKKSATKKTATTKKSTAAKKPAGATTKKRTTIPKNETMRKKAAGAKSRSVWWVIRYWLVTVILTLVVGLPFFILAACAVLFAIAKISVPALIEAISSLDMAALGRVIYEQVSRGWLVMALVWVGLGLGLMIVWLIKKVQDYGR
ncbi:hypothetical protein FWH30_01065 [Microgenomates group bacterium]|nr:hypothetical protein [Microgenomates group bacterium]